MKLQKYEEDEKLVSHRHNLLNWRKEIEEVDKLNKLEELETDIDTYISNNYDKLTTGDAYALWDFFNWIKNK